MKVANWNLLDELKKLSKLPFVDFFRSAYGLDYRALALFRFGLGIALIGDLLDRARDLEAHYSDSGIVPRHDVLRLFGVPEWIHIHFSTGETFYVGFIFVLHGIISFFFAIGYKMRISSILCLVFQLSLQARNYFVLHGGDVILRCMLWWACFLPLEKVWSVDAYLEMDETNINKRRGEKFQLKSFLHDLNTTKELKIEESQDFMETSSDSNDQFSSLDRRPTRKRRNSEDSENSTSSNPSQTVPTNPSNKLSHAPLSLRYKGMKVPVWFLLLSSERQNVKSSTLSVGTVGVLLQLGIIYYASYFTKFGAAWRSDYSATRLALSLDYFQMPFGWFLLNYLPDWGLQLLTWSVIFWEHYGPILLWFLVLFRPPFVRWFTSMGFLCLHFGFAICLRLGMFFWTSFFSHMIYLPPLFFDIVMHYLHPARALKGKFQKNALTTIYYPMSCYRCQKRAYFLSTFVLHPSITIFNLSKHPNLSQEERSTNSETEGSKMQNEWVGMTIDGGEVRGAELFVQIFCQFPVWIWTYSILYPILSGNQIIRWCVEGKSLSATFLFSFLHLECVQHPEQTSDHMTKLVLSVERRQKERKRARQQLTVRRVWKLTKWLAITAICVALFLFVLYWNMKTIYPEWHDNPINNPTYVHFAYATHLEQSWGMFAPSPPTIDYWFIFYLRLHNNSVVEIFRNGGLWTWQGSEPTMAPPPVWSVAFKNHRWYKFYEHGVNGIGERSNYVRPRMGSWICRKWKDHHPDAPAIVLDVYMVHRNTQTYQTHRESLLFQHTC